MNSGSSLKTFIALLVVMLLLVAPTAVAQASRAASAASYFDRGSAWHAKGELDRAISDYNFAIRFDPRHVPALFQRGVARKAKGDLDGALVDFTRALEIRTDFAAAPAQSSRAATANSYLERGNAWSAKGEWERAIADYDLAIATNPKLALAYSNRGAAGPRRCRGGAG